MTPSPWGVSMPPHMKTKTKRNLNNKRKLKTKIKGQTYNRLEQIALECCCLDVRSIAQACELHRIGVLELLE